VIASRRKETIKESRRGGRNRVSTADRAVAANRAKRNATLNARRGNNNNNNNTAGGNTRKPKPSRMEIEQEIKTQKARSQKAKAMQEIQQAGGRVAATAGRRRRAATKAAGGTVKRGPPVQTTGGGGGGRARRVPGGKVISTNNATVQMAAAKPPTKKAVNAAVQAFKANGFQIPAGSQMVIRFEQPTGRSTSH